MKPLHEHIIDFCNDRIERLNNNIQEAISGEHYEVANILNSNMKCFEEVRSVVVAYELVQTLTDLENEGFSE